MKPSLLLIHGLGSSARAFDALRAQPALQGHATHAPDLPGFGGKADDPALARPFAAAHAFLLDYVNNIEGPLAVIGHSMGGALGLKLADALPERVSAYVSIEGNLIPEDCGLLSRKLAGAESEEAQNTMKADLIAFAKTLNASWQDWADDLAPVDARTFRNYARDLVNGTDSGEYLTLFEALSCPKLYMHGDLYKDQKLLTVLPSEIVRHVPDSGHFTMQDQPALSATAILNFLESGQ